MAKNDQIAVASELGDRTEAELRSLVAVKREDLHKAKFKQSLGQLRETHLIGRYKRDIAVIETVLRQRALQSAAQSPSEE